MPVGNLGISLAVTTRSSFMDRQRTLNSDVDWRGSLTEAHVIASNRSEVFGDRATGPLSALGQCLREGGTGMRFALQSSQFPQSSRRWIFDHLSVTGAELAQFGLSVNWRTVEAFVPIGPIGALADEGGKEGRPSGASTAT